MVLICEFLGVLSPSEPSFSLDVDFFLSCNIAMLNGLYCFHNQNDIKLFFTFFSECVFGTFITILKPKLSYG